MWVFHISYINQADHGHLSVTDLLEAAFFTNRKQEGAISGPFEL